MEKKVPKNSARRLVILMGAIAVLSLIWSSVSATIAPHQQSLAVLTSSCKKGVGGEVRSGDPQILNMGWWYNWQFPEIALQGAGLVPMGRSAGYDAVKVKNFAQNNPGRYWLIGNEPMMPDQDRFQDNPVGAAQSYRTIMEDIRSVDSSAKFIIGGFLICHQVHTSYPHSCYVGRNSTQTGINYTDNRNAAGQGYWNAFYNEIGSYLNSLGSNFAGWHIHIYYRDWEADDYQCSWSIDNRCWFIDMVNEFREWQDSKTPGKELWMTEFAILRQWFNTTDEGPGRARTFINETGTWMEGTSKVNRYAWYLVRPNSYTGASVNYALFTTSTGTTVRLIGETYKNLPCNMPLPTVDIKANNADGVVNIPYGTSATLSWTSTNAANCEAYGNWSGAKPITGSGSTGNLFSTKTYTLSCSSAGGTASDSVTVNVVFPPTVDLKANSSDGPITISYNTSTTLSWTSTNSTSCTASGDWTGAKATSGSESTANLTSTKTYTLTCTGTGGTANDNVTVNVTAPPAVPTVDLKANNSDGPITISYNSSATLSWTSTNSTSCTASGDWSGTKAISGSESTANLTSTKTYTLTCTGTGGSASDSVTVNVTTPPVAPTVDLKANNSDGPITISYNTSTTLSWTSTNTTSCTASGDWSGTKATSGSEATGNLTSAKTYTLTCLGAGGSASDSVTVNVTAPPVANFIGFNTRGIVHYGYGDILLYTRTSDVDADLAEIQRVGGNLVRVFVANKYITDDEAARRLNMFLDKAATYKISVIASLIDFYNSGFNPQGTDQSYTGSYLGNLLLGHEFFASGYKGRYESFVRTVVSCNKNHSSLYAWEPGNELKDDSSPQTFIDFMKDITATIKSIDSSHYVATGMINAGHTALTPTQLYPYLANVDIITIHGYNGDHAGAIDIDWASANNKKTIFEEIGYSGSGDRSGSMRAELDYWKNKNVSSVLQWGFLAKGLSDNGDGDREFGFDNIWHTDYDSLSALFQSYNKILTGSLSCSSATESSISMNYSYANGTNVSLFRGEVLIAAIGSSSNSGSYTDTSLSANTSYTYYLRNGTFSTSPLLASQVCSTTAPPPTGSLSCSSATQNSVTLAYNYGNGGNVSLFRDTTRVTTLGSGSGTGSYTDTSLSANTSYTYYLRNGTSSTSPLLAIQACSTTAPLATGSLSCSSATESSITMNYSYSNGTNTSLFRETTLLTTFDSTSGAGSYTDTNLSSNTLYTYFLRNGVSSSATILSSRNCSTTTIIPEPELCTLSTASWEVASTEEKQIVSLNVTGIGDCADKTVNLRVIKKDGVPANTQPLPSSLSFGLDSQIVAAWKAEFDPLSSGDRSEYYFEATLVGGETIESSPKFLMVTKIPIVPAEPVPPSPPSPPSPPTPPSLSISELQAEIARLVKLINQLQAQLAQLRIGETIPLDYRFSKILKYGNRSNDVRYLQIFLKTQGSQIYPEGLITGYFDLATKKAVIRFQEKYAKDILLPLRLTKGTGIVGLRTIFKINELLGK